MENMKSIDELRTFVGLMMEDLRGNWGFDYVERIEIVQDVLGQIEFHENASEHDKKYANHDYQLCEQELENYSNGEHDGRIFRDCAQFYGWKSMAGVTENVIENLKTYATYFEDLGIK